MNLAFVALLHWKFFAFGLAGLANNLSILAVRACSSEVDIYALNGWVSILHVQALSTLALVGGNKCEEAVDKREDHSIPLNLKAGLNPLWQELSDCIITDEAKWAVFFIFFSCVNVRR